MSTYQSHGAKKSTGFGSSAFAMAEVPPADNAPVAAPTNAGKKRPRGYCTNETCWRDSLPWQAYIAVCCLFCTLPKFLSYKLCTIAGAHRLSHFLSLRGISFFLVDRSIGKVILARASSHVC